MKPPEFRPTIPRDIDGNAFSVLGNTKRALKAAGADKEYIDDYVARATSGDYDYLLQVTIGEVDFV